ncbi:hypothetical protein DFH11DRAFT_1510280 [Phellopilus nigrolimitatus]|nr:hypothetical protein DFH11DRAFT_1510280 [Phellopilus nigrolimitatus]
MHNGSRLSSSRQRSASRSSSDDGDEGNDEDHTARLSNDRRLSFHAKTDDNESALQRVKSLTQRNRLVLNKLASISSGSRLSTPSPTTLSRLSRSPVPSSANSTGTSSRVSNNSARRRPESLSRASGSETEREHAQDATSSSDAETPTSATASHFRSASVKERRVSAPIAPSRDLVRPSSRERPSEPSEAYSAGKRPLRPESRGSGEVEAAALAAVANSRRRSPSDVRRRQPLPREFRGGRSSIDEDVSTPPPEVPSTPRKNSDRASLYSNHSSPSSRVATVYDSPQSPRGKSQRYSTVREMTRRHQTRWLSQDIISPPRGGSEEDAQGRRGGSGESPLVLGGRSVIGESLRAAGLARRRDDGEDVFGGGEVNRRVRLSSDIGARPSTSRAETMRDSTRYSERPSTSDGEFYREPRTPANPTYNVAQRNAYTDQADRPATSMAAYYDEPRTAPPQHRTYKSVHPESERERQAPELAAEAPARPPSQSRNVYSISSAAANGRTSGSQSTLGRRATMSPLNAASAAASATAESTPEHTRLMLDSLNMFESQIARLPSMGSTTTVTIPELFRSAQNIVHSTNALNGLLRSGTAHALEEQIDAEVGDDGKPIDLVGLWRDVGAEYRESVRVSDELVRTMTSFLLGVGKVLRDTTADKVHNRTISLDETISRRNTPDVAFAGGGRASDGKRSSDGHSSVDGKRRWGGSSGDMGGTTTSFTSLNNSSSASLQAPSSSRPSAASKARFEAENGPEPLNDAVTRKLSRLSLTTTRRTDSSQDLRDVQAREPTAPAMHASYSEDYENPTDSPLAAASAARQGQPPRRANTLAVPPPLSTLPSESLLTRRTSVKAATLSRRPKVSTASVASTRAPAIFPQITGSGEPTTAINKTQASPERPVVRGGRSAGPAPRTFSRTSAAALAGLQQQIEQDGRKRTTSASSALESEARQARLGSDSERTDARMRSSLDSNTSGMSTTRTGRDRRGTMTGLFTRS